MSEMKCPKCQGKVREVYGHLFNPFNEGSYYWRCDSCECIFKVLGGKLR